MKYKAIIFDLDGVICFTDEYHYLAWKELADELNIPFDRTINERLRGVSRMDSLEIILEKYSGPEFSKDEKEKFCGKKNDIYRKSLENMSEKDLSEEVRETLKELRNRGLKLAIGSSSKNTKFILKQIGLEGFFDAISDGTNITRSKPDPEVFLKAAQFLAEEPKDCLVIEDAEAGIDAAVAGGFDNAGIGSASDYSKSTYRLGSFSDILKIV
ncbi:beta-phosphoglucomutase [Butyrivibrio sp. AE2032]|uniref:beta-phosphoglucomutase n=1 Tax=Butyrivibrio sp. AE2032 TaxID=1458463 RepID=UPI0005570C45|nr:beta-phosphoglucomutase [Butyrivibrio sp. AE2032]